MLLIPHTAFLEPSLTGSTASVLHSGHPAVSTPPHCGMRTRRCQPAKSTFAHRTQWSTVRYLSVPTTSLDVNHPSTMATVRTQPLAAVSLFVQKLLSYVLTSTGWLLTAESTLR